MQAHKPNFIWKADLHNYIYKGEYKLLVNNDEGKLLNTLGYSVLVKKSNEIISPATYSDARFSALQLKVISILKEKGFKVYDQPVDTEFINYADELWLISNYYGLYIRTGYDDKRFYQSDLSEQIIKEINDLSFSDL